jgi:hypothetical protein
LDTEADALPYGIVEGNVIIVSMSFVRSVSSSNAKAKFEYNNNCCKKCPWEKSNHGRNQNTMMFDDEHNREFTSAIVVGPERIYMPLPLHHEHDEGYGTKGVIHRWGNRMMWD